MASVFKIFDSNETTLWGTSQDVALIPMVMYYYLTMKIHLRCAQQPSITTKVQHPQVKERENLPWLQINFFKCRQSVAFVKKKKAPYFYCTHCPSKGNGPLTLSTGGPKGLICCWFEWIVVCWGKQAANSCCLCPSWEVFTFVKEKQNKTT